MLEMSMDVTCQLGSNELIDEVIISHGGKKVKTPKQQVAHSVTLACCKVPGLARF